MSGSIFLKYILIIYPYGFFVKYDFRAKEKPPVLGRVEFVSYSIFTARGISLC